MEINGHGAIIASVSILGIILFGEFFIWELNNYIRLADHHGSVTFGAIGGIQVLIAILLCYTVWRMLSGYYIKPGKGRRGFVFILITWLAWMSFVGGMVHQDDFSQALIMLWGVISGFLLMKTIRVDKWFVAIALAFMCINCTAAYDLFPTSKQNSLLTHRWHGPWINANTYGAVCAIMVIFCVSFFSAKTFHALCFKKSYLVINKSVVILIIWALVATTCYGLIKSGSRTAVSYSVGALIIYAIIAYYNRDIRVIKGSLVILACTLSMLFFSLVSPHDRQSVRLLRYDWAGDLSIYHRLVCWRAALVVWFDNPLWGYGWSFLDVLDARRVVLGISDVRAAMLNNFTQTLATRGILGGGGLFYVTGIILVQSYRNTCIPGFTPIGLASVFMVFMSLINDVLYSISLGPLYWALFFEVNRWDYSPAVRLGDSRF